MTNTVQLIPLSKLTVSDHNVRKTGVDDGIEELKASITAHGLLQSLVVQKGKRGKFGVIAGGRRLRALKALAQSGVIDAELNIPCNVIANDAEVIELSLAENIIRAPMHPADQFEAFCAVIDQGKSITDVAARFSVSEELVQKRLRLDRLSPIVLQAYRDNVIDLEQAQAFALSDDHAEQERVFADFGDDHPRSIRAALSHGEVPSTDRRVRFLGEEAYVAAGGSVRRDLFSDKHSFYVQDEALLESLVAGKLNAIAETVKAEGWQWVNVDMKADYSALSAYSRQQPGHTELSEEAQNQIAQLSDEYDSIVESMPDDEDADQRLEDLQRQIDALQPAEIWSAETIAVCGVILLLQYDGSVRIERGLMKAADARKLKVHGGNPAASNLLPAKLLAELTAQKTAVLRVELAKQPPVALAVLTHALLLHLWYGYGAARDSCLDLSAKSKALLFDVPPLAEEAFADICRTWETKLPENTDGLWDWCLAQPLDTLVELLGYLVASTVDAVQEKTDSPNTPRLRHANSLADILKLDMSVWYTPTAHGYFSRVSRKIILAAIDEAKGSHGPALETLGKKELAQRAEQLIAGTGWLPAPLRVGNPHPRPLPEAS